MWPVRTRPGSIFGRWAHVPVPGPTPEIDADIERFVRMMDARLESLPLPVAPPGPDTSAFLATLDAALEAWWRTAPTGPDSAVYRWTTDGWRHRAPRRRGRHGRPGVRLRLRVRVA